MFKDAFVRLDTDETGKILKETEKRIDTISFEAGRTTVLACDLPFYPDCRLLDIADHAAAPVLRRFVVYKPGLCVVLDGEARTIYDLNKKAPLSLNGENVSDYLRFFFIHARGEKGSFHVVESTESLAWLEEPPLSARKSLGKAIEPVLLLGYPGTEGTYILSACMIYDSILLRAEIRIDKGGAVEFSNQTVLLDGMPLLDEILELHR